MQVQYGAFAGRHRSQACSVIESIDIISDGLARTAIGNFCNRAGKVHWRRLDLSRINLHSLLLLLYKLY